jgi:hypothetical protein
MTPLQVADRRFERIDHPYWVGMVLKSVEVPPVSEHGGA